MNPEQNTPSMAPVHELSALPPRRHAGLIVGTVIGILVILGGGGAVAYAAMQGWITLPYNFLAPEPPSMQDIQKAVSNIKSGSITLSVDYSAQAKQDGTVIIPKYPEIIKATSTGLRTNEQEILTESIKEATSDRYSQMFMDARLGLTTQSTFESGDKPDTQGNLKFTYQNSGMTLVFDSDYLYKDESFFVKLNAFPLPILDFSTLTGKWIHLTKNSYDPIALLGGTDRSTTIWENIKDDSSTSSTANLAQPAIDYQKELVLVRDTLISKQALIIQSAKLVTDTQGRRVWRLNVGLDSDKIIEALSTAIEQRPQQEKYAVLTDDLKAQIQDGSFKPWITAVAQAVTSEMDIDQKTFIPLQQSFHLRFATEASQKLTTPKEFLVTTNYILDQVNQTISVTAPTEAIEPNRAIQLLMGKTDEEVKRENQIKAVDEIKSALTYYKYQHNGQYPDNLNQLIEIRDSYDPPATIATTTKNDFLKLLERKVVRIPNDLYTNQPFVYSVSAEKKNYTLKYQIQIGTDANAEYVKEMYIDGLNTATANSVSLERDQTKDSDKDGILDIEERKLGTSAYSQDTDLDGFTDKQEIDGGFDPLTNSKNGKKYGTKP